MLKTLRLAIILATAAFFALDSNLLLASPQKVLQIFLPGGFKGNLAQLDENLRLNPGPQLLLPKSIQKAKSKQKDTIVYSIGDISSMESHFSHLSRGTEEISLIKACNPVATAISPDDLEAFNLTATKDFIQGSVLSNSKGKSYRNPFKLWAEHGISGRSLWFFNFVAPERGRSLALGHWNDFELDDPVVALKRLNLPFKKNHISISTVYGPNSDVKEISAWFKRMPGIHLIVHRPKENEQSEFPSYAIGFEGNTCVFSLGHKENALPMLNMHFKTHGTPRVTLRNLPIDTSLEMGAAQKAGLQKLQNLLLEPITLITTEQMPSTAIKKLDSNALAKGIKNQTRAQMAVILEPDQEYFSENLVRVGTLIKHLKNDRVFVVRIRGKTLERLILSLHRSAAWLRWHCAGCSYRYSLGRLLSIKINGEKFSPKDYYTVAMTEKALENPVIKAIFEKDGYDILNKKLLWDLAEAHLKRGDHQGAIFDKGL